jgi:hypothetical protein
MEVGNGIGIGKWNWKMELGLEINGFEIGMKLEIVLGNEIG